MFARVRPNVDPVAVVTGQSRVDVIDASRVDVIAAGPLSVTRFARCTGGFVYEFRDRFGAVLASVTSQLDGPPDADFDDPTSCPTCGHSGGTVSILGRRFHPECARQFQAEFDAATALDSLA